MVNSVNTAWKLTDLQNTALFTFDSANGWHPVNVSQDPLTNYDLTDLPQLNLEQAIAMGLGGRSITLQGTDLDDKDNWTLSSTIAQQQLMKLWVGEDWFYYVEGNTTTQINDEAFPTQTQYIASFRAHDPHYYYSRSTAGSGTGKNVVVPISSSGAYSAGGSTKVFVSDLTSSTLEQNLGTVFVEPCFWIICENDGATVADISEVTLTDDYGRKIVYTPTTPMVDGDIHVILPYRNTSDDGFSPNDGVGLHLSAAGMLNINPPTAYTGVDNSAVDDKGTSMVDTTRDFVKLGVKIGDTISNDTDVSTGVITTITTTTNANDTLNFSGGLSGGTGDDFDNGDTYTINSQSGHDYGTWLMDVLQHGAGSDDSETAANNVYKWFTEEKNVVSSRNGTDFIPKDRNYPRYLINSSTNGITFSVSGSGDETGASIVAIQFVVRRV